MSFIIPFSSPPSSFRPHMISHQWPSRVISHQASRKFTLRVTLRVALFLLTAIISCSDVSLGIINPSSASPVDRSVERSSSTPSHAPRHATSHATTAGVLEPLGEPLGVDDKKNNTKDDTGENSQMSNTSKQTSKKTPIQHVNVTQAKETEKKTVKKRRRPANLRLTSEVK